MAAGEHDADDHRDRREQAGVGAGHVGDDGGVRRAVQFGEARRQVDEGRDAAQHGRDHGGDVEAAVDRREAALALAGAGDVDADHGGDDADGRHDQREQQALQAERGRAEDQRGHQRDGVGLEQVRGHPGAVADVVAHVVGDRRGVAGVVLGDALLDLADQVGAHVGGLGEDAAADPHEHGEQRGAEAEALQHPRGLAGVDQHDHGRPEQAEADGEHADHAAGAERDAGGLLAAARLARRRRDPDVGARGQPHPQRADRGGEQRADDEEDRSPDALAEVLARAARRAGRTR